MVTIRRVMEMPMVAVTMEVTAHVRALPVTPVLLETVTTDSVVRTITVPVTAMMVNTIHVATTAVAISRVAVISNRAKTVGVSRVTDKTKVAISRAAIRVITVRATIITWVTTLKTKVAISRVSKVVTSRTVVAMRRAVVSRAVSVRVSRDKVVAMPMAAVRSSVVETMIRMPSTHRKSVLSIRRKITILRCPCA